jgi:hypothetical protein
MHSARKKKGNQRECLLCSKPILFTWLAAEPTFGQLRSKLDPEISDGKVKGKKSLPNEDAKRQSDPKDFTNVGQLFSSTSTASWYTHKKGGLELGLGLAVGIRIRVRV